MRLNGPNTRLVTLLKYTVTGTNDYNEDIYDWVADTTNTATDASGRIYAQQRFEGGNEGLESGQVVAWQKGLFKIRYISELDPRNNKKVQQQYRIQDGDLFYDIENVRPIDRNTGLWLKLKAADNE